MPSAAALQHQQGLAGDSPKGAIKITRGGWDVTSSGKPERMVRDTEEMWCVLKRGAREEEEGSSFSLPIRTRRLEVKLQFKRG